MRFPSFDNIFSSALSTFKRFPLTIICVYLATFVMMWYTDRLFDNHEVLKLTYVALVGGLLFLSARIATESHNLTKFVKGIIYFLSFSIVIIYYILVPSELKDASKCLLWISIGLVIIGHLLVSVVPYIYSNRSTLSFRSYNYQLLIKFSAAVFYSLVLYATLSLALVSINALFDFNFRGNTFARLFIFLAGIFNTTYFLSQFPKEYDSEIFGQPKGLKVLAEYIMIPVLIIYTLILYAYIIKVIGATENPLPEVRYMIIAFLVFGVFTYLINYYDESEKKSLASKYYVKLFFPIALPVSILLLYTTWNESEKSGITDELYLNAIIAIWAIGMAVYIFISKRDDIKWIPISLLGISIISFFTPLIGICSVTVKSQYNTAVRYMQEENILIAGSLQKAKDADKIKQGYIYDAINYLDDYKRLDLIHYLDKNDIVSDSLDSGYKILGELNMVRSYRYSNEINIINIYNDEVVNLDIREYDELFKIEQYLKKDGRHAEFITNENRIVIKNELKEIINSYDIMPQLNILTEETKYIDLEDETSRVRFFITYLDYNKDTKYITTTSGILLYKSKKQKQ